MGILHTHSASTKVMTEPMRVASQAGRRNTASMTSSETTGISATRHVSVRLSSGSSTWVNMSSPPVGGANGGHGAWLLSGLRLPLVDTTPAPPALEAGQASTYRGSGSTFAPRAGSPAGAAPSARPDEAAGEQHEQGQPVDEAAEARTGRRGRCLGRGVGAAHG